MASVCTRRHAISSGAGRGLRTLSSPPATLSKVTSQRRRCRAASLQGRKQVSPAPKGRAGTAAGWWIPLEGSRDGAMSPSLPKQLRSEPPAALPSVPCWCSWLCLEPFVADLPHSLASSDRQPLVLVRSRSRAHHRVDIAHVPPKRRMPFTSRTPRSRRRLSHPFGPTHVERLPLGCPKIRLSIDITGGLLSHTPRCASDARCHARVAGRLRGSSPPWRSTPPLAPRACCISQPTLRFAGFCSPPCPVSGTVLRTPHQRHTLQSVPLPSRPPHVTAVRYTPSSLRAAHPRDLEVFLHSRVRCVASPLPAWSHPLLSWASLPGTESGPLLPRQWSQYPMGATSTAEVRKLRAPLRPASRHRSPTARATDATAESLHDFRGSRIRFVLRLSNPISSSESPLPCSEEPVMPNRRLAAEAARPLRALASASDAGAACAVRAESTSERGSVRPRHRVSPARGRCSGTRRANAHHCAPRLPMPVSSPSRSSSSPLFTSGRGLPVRGRIDDASSLRSHPPPRPKPRRSRAYMCSIRSPRVQCAAAITPT
jgi:hypothetical protein